MVMGALIVILIIINGIVEVSKKLNEAAKPNPPAPTA
jgi:hypothetical protein